MVCLVEALFALVAPAALAPVLVVVGLLLMGAVFFVGMLMFDRKSLDAVPDARRSSDPQAMDDTQTTSRERPLAPWPVGRA